MFKVVGVFIDKLVKQKQLRIANKIFGDKNFLGPAAVFKIFGVRLSWEQIPKIPFSRKELLRARELCQFLVLGIEELADGRPATIVNLCDFFQSILVKIKNQKVLYGDVDYRWRHSFDRRQEPFFFKETPKLQWYLASGGAIKNSLGVNYLVQTQSLVDYIINMVFCKQTLPKAYQDAIAEFISQKNVLEVLLEKDQQAANIRLSQLIINRLGRRTAVVAFFHYFFYTLNLFNCINDWDGLLFECDFDWTNTLDSNGLLVNFGHPGTCGGVCFAFSNANKFASSMGVCFVRYL